MYCNENNEDNVSFGLINEDHLHVYLRIKDCFNNNDNLYEVVDSETITCRTPEDPNVVRSIKEDAVIKKYTFSKIFGPETTQVEIFDALIKSKLDKFINGHNSTLLTYGVSSSGKTYTIVGSAAEPGLIPRSLEYLFKNLPVSTKIPSVKPLPFGKVSILSEKQQGKDRILKDEILNFKTSNIAKCDFACFRQEQTEELPTDSETSIWISFAEIYNEHIFDLLQPGAAKKEKLKLSCANGEAYVKNLNLVHVVSGSEAYQVLQYGLHHLNYAKTKINNHSSRSHFIFTVWLMKTGKDIGADCRISHFNFCDLAGAERSKKTLNVGDRLKESNNINTSLLVLGRCIAAVRRAQHSLEHHIVPFRESKLTRLFQKALSGYEDIFMVVNINPCREHFEETQHVLNFSAVAKDIVVGERTFTPLNNEINQDSSDILKQNSSVSMEQDINRSSVAEVSDVDMEDDSIKSEINLKLKCETKNEDSSEEMQCELLTLQHQYGAHNEEETQVYQESDTSTTCSIYDITSSEGDFDITSTICLLNSDGEDLESNDWRREVKNQENLIAEHHKTIYCLKEQIQEIRLKHDAEMIEKDSKIQELIERVHYMEEERKILLYNNFLT